MSEETVKVVVRVRPFIEKEKAKSIYTSIVLENQ